MSFGSCSGGVHVYARGTVLAGGPARRQSSVAREGDNATIEMDPD
jgi:hypothetical protein